jgi:hypothetical protein
VGLLGCTLIEGGKINLSKKVKTEQMSQVKKFEAAEVAEVVKAHNASDLPIGLPSAISGMEAGDYSAEWLGQGEHRSGEVNKPKKADGTPNPNHKKKWSNLSARMKVETGEVINVTVDPDSLLKMKEGELYDIVVFQSGEYKNARLKQAIA